MNRWQARWLAVAGVDDWYGSAGVDGVPRPVEVDNRLSQLLVIATGVVVGGGKYAFPKGA
jgi:hypothetical protein